MIWLSVIIITVVTINADEPDNFDEYWQKFLQDFNPKYKDPTEYEYRKLIFMKNLKEILAHNEEYKAGLHTYSQGVNQFADKTDLELRSLSTGFLGSVLKMSLHRTRKNEFRHNDSIEVPESVDWRERGAVTPVLNQGQCFSCWSFSAIGAIEGQYYLATNKSVELSKQHLVDCSNQNDGCKGGLMREAFEDLARMGGVATEEAYPYKNRDQKCKFKKHMAVATIDGYVPIEEGDENALKQAVALHGPIAVGIQVTRTLHRYHGGVLNAFDCSRNPRDMDHGVLVVGYGSEDGEDYWLVKNSWGAIWGVDGYVKMSRNKNNQCHIASYATYPNVFPVDN